MEHTTMRVTAKESGRGLLNSKSLGRYAVARNTILLSAGPAALCGMNQFAVAVVTTTFAFVNGRDGLAGIGPAIFLARAVFAAFAPRLLSIQCLRPLAYPCSRYLGGS
jgi:hypothetical protein